MFSILAPSCSTISSQMASGVARGYRLLPGFFKSSIVSHIRSQPFTMHQAKGGRPKPYLLLAGCDPEAFYVHSAQRWLWDEPEQLRRRYVKFNLNGLVQIAEEAAGADATCVNVSKLPEGNFNKAFLATMRDGKQLVVKIPNPNSGPAHYTTASEVATMQYVRDKLHVPVPKVLKYCSMACNSKLGAEYIVMERVPGVELTQKWEGLKFPYHGALYRRQDVTGSESIIIDDEFSIVLTIGRAWFDNRRGEIDVPRGPWPSAGDLMKALVQREAACLEKFPTFPQDCQQGLFGGPGGYHPTKEAKLSVLRDFLKIHPHIIPRNEKVLAGVIWHNDLHMDNIFVNTKDPSQITGIIDWQAAPIYPMFLVAHHPSLIEYEGPRLNGFVQPILPEDFKTLDPEAQKAAKDLFLAQSFWLTYEIEVQRAAPQLLHTFCHRETLPGQILGMIGSIFDDGEPYMQSLLADITKEHVWKEVVGEDENGNFRVPCPLRYSEQDMARQTTEYAKWEKDVERKARVLDEIGVYYGWNGAVSPGNYDQVKTRLAAAEQNFLARESRNEKERAEWEKVWPFQDSL